MLFSDIIGQKSIITHLLKTVSENRISHAQLFLGAEGYGTLPIALAYAQFIMCQNPGQTDACGQCNSCKKISTLQHPDLHFAFPAVGTKNNNPLISDDYIAEFRKFIINNPYGSYEEWLNAMDAGNQQGSIKVKEAENIVRKLSMKSFEAEFKIMIIWFPEKMNAESANKLLKLIEEPPAKTLFFLVAENSEFIISTILSRTQLVKIPRISEDDMFIGLQIKHQLSDEKARQISRMSEGDYNQAREYIAASDDTKQNFLYFIQMMRLSYTAKFIDIVKWVDEISKIGRERQKTFLNYSLRMVRENFVLNQKQANMARLTDDEEAFAAKFSNFIHDKNTPFLAAELDKAYVHIGRNANAKVVFLDMCIKLNRYLKM